MEEKKATQAPAEAAAKKNDNCNCNCKGEVKMEKGNASIQKNAVKKEVPDFRMDDNKSDVLIMKEFYTLLYGYLAQRVIDSFGAEGNQIVRRALRDFGQWRGAKLRERQLHYGLDINLQNLNNYSDLPGDDEQETNRQIFEKDQFLSYVDQCDMYDLWKEHNLNDAAVAYCEEIHHAMWATYDPDVVVVQKEILTRGDPRCSFDLSMPNYGKKCGACKDKKCGK